MDFSLSEDEQAYRDKVRQLVDDVDGAQMRAFWAEQHALGGDRMFPWALSAHKVLVEQGLIGLDWPAPWGKGATSSEVFVVAEELVAAGFPSSPVTSSHSLVRGLISHGSPKIVEEQLPKVLAGDLRYAGGLSEPEAGSDLFALRTTAVRHGDEYVVNGSKLWTSYAHEAQYISTLVRTDPESTRHRGLSMLLIPTDAPGMEIKPVWVVGGWRVNQCFFEDVRVPVSNRLGPENEGAAILSAGLSAERSMSFGGTESRLLLARLLHRFAGAADELQDNDLEAIGRFVTKLEVERLLNVAANAKGIRGEEASVAGSMGKVFGSELAQEFAQWLNELLADSLYQREWGAAADDQLAADAEWFVRGTVTVTVAGGTSEIQRNAIAQRGLGLPKGA
ncbi:acyl-CoA dehydrogenase family protein [Nocardia fusca]|uniref:acyl-CoA dehydrogenase family protein n=1 Tax=Nocardia fusca TaxID=941183 RepID=UPI003796E0D5